MKTLGLLLFCLLAAPLAHAEDPVIADPAPSLGSPEESLPVENSATAPAAPTAAAPEEPHAVAAVKSLNEPINAPIANPPPAEPAPQQAAPAPAVVQATPAPIPQPVSTPPPVSAPDPSFSQEPKPEHMYNTDNGLPPPGQGAESKSEHELLREHLNHEKEYAADTEEYRRKELVRHEAAKFHFGFDYVFNEFDKYNFNKGSPTGGTQTRASRGGSLELMYFPLSHDYGRFGIGGHVSVLYAKPDSQISGTSPDFYIGGARAIYEFEYIYGQILVPFVQLSLDYVKQKPYTDNLNINSTTGLGTGVDSQSFSSLQGGIGIMINLNSFDRGSAKAALQDSGVKKYLLSYSYEKRQNADPTKEGYSHYLGLRFEY